MSENRPHIDAIDFLVYIYEKKTLFIATISFSIIAWFITTTTLFTDKYKSSIFIADTSFLHMDVSQLSFDYISNQNVKPEEFLHRVIQIIKDEDTGKLFLKSNTYLDYPDSKKSLVNKYISSNAISVNQLEKVHEIKITSNDDRINTDLFLKDYIEFSHDILIHQLIKVISLKIEDIENKKIDSISSYREKIEFEVLQTETIIKIKQRENKIIIANVLRDLVNNKVIADMLGYDFPIFEKLFENNKVSTIPVGSDVSAYILDLPRYLLGSNILGHEINRLSSMEPNDLIDASLITQLVRSESVDILLDEKLVPGLYELDYQIYTYNNIIDELALIREENKLTLLSIENFSSSNTALEKYKSLLISIFSAISLSLIILLLQIVRRYSLEKNKIN